MHIRSVAMVRVGRRERLHLEGQRGSYHMRMIKGQGSGDERRGPVWLSVHRVSRTWRPAGPLGEGKRGRGGGKRGRKEGGEGRRGRGKKGVEGRGAEEGSGEGRGREVGVKASLGGYI